MSKLGTSLTQAAQVALDVFAAISGAYYSRKYATLTRRLGLPRFAESDRRGFVVIQIDGLAHSYLQTAIEQGYAPNIQRLIRRGVLSLHSWRTGLPSSTPAAQAGIMFGANDNIPAFRWYDKLRAESVVCKFPAPLHAIRANLPNRGPGLLRGGSSLMNMFDGDAATSIFTVGALQQKSFFEGVRGIGFLVLFLLNPIRTVKIGVLSLWEYLVDLFQRTRARLRRQYPRPLAAAFPFLRVLSNVILREIQTFAVLLDIYRGVPSIYTTYYGYDELAHSYGPTSRVAFRALHAIDARIHQIEVLRRMGLTRDYDLFVLSDHGMTPSVPFEHASGQTLGQFVRSAAGQARQLSEAATTWTRDSLGPYYLLEELRAIEAGAPAGLRHIPAKIRQLVAARVGREPEEGEIWNAAQHGDLVVLNSGPMSHVYLNVTAKQLDLSEIAAFHPELVGSLLAHAGIGLVLGRESGQVYVMSSKGLVVLGEGYQVEGADPLAALPDPQLSAAQLKRLALFPNSGDLIIMGSYDEAAGSITCFEPQWACHGGMGGPQEVAFMLKPAELAWKVDRVQQATEIYALFAAHYALC